MNANSMKTDERILFALRALYDGCGYAKYKMSKFEEYELYVRNKDFLISDSIITFTDTNGKLMALKPDVTLSIVKNSRDSAGVQRLYYNENVYRVSKGSHAFKEIMQAGLECIGQIDDYCIFEVLMLAAESLRCISDDFVLNISHLGLLSAVLEGMGVSPADRPGLIRCIGEKNAHELRRSCDLLGVDPQPLLRLTECYGSPVAVLPGLRDLLGDHPSLLQLERLTAGFTGSDLADRLRIDFSVVNDVNYYNGVVFKGFIRGVPAGVLSGGQYDRLMKKMGRQSGAIGFAIYLDQLERLNEREKRFDVDVVLLYDEADLAGLGRAVQQLRSRGSSVSVQRSLPEKIRCRQLARYENGEVKILEEYA